MHLVYLFLLSLTVPWLMHCIQFTNQWYNLIVYTYYAITLNSIYVILFCDYDFRNELENWIWHSPRAVHFIIQYMWKDSIKKSMDMMILYTTCRTDVAQPKLSDMLIFGCICWRWLSHRAPVLSDRRIDTDWITSYP